MSIFRRMFNRKDTTDKFQNKPPMSTDISIAMVTPTAWSHSPKTNRKFSNSNQGNIPVLQLTPLWEHIIRTRTLPENLDPVDMFNEFLERLRDPEWQVRQHALRVLVDVLLVLGQKSDAYFHKIIPQLVENLGHEAPTVRKGALDCLRVYLCETAMPESILLEILDIGLNQRITNEPFGGRLTCSVMLSLPILVQTILETPKRNFILRSTIEMLSMKMTQITHQEITLKVLNKIKELISDHEFSGYMSEKSLKEFNLLCNVYGINETNKSRELLTSWKVIPSFDSDSDTYQSIEPYWKAPETKSDENRAKVILETEIKINEDTLTMRILEANEDNQSDDGKIQKRNENVILNDSSCIYNNGNYIDNNSNSNNSNSNSISNENSNNDFIFTDSEIEDLNFSVIDNSDEIPFAEPRTPRRVTFGGEVVKMRTPDSDTTAIPSDYDDGNISKSTNVEIISSAGPSSKPLLSYLTVEILNDNTKPIVVEAENSSSKPTTPRSQNLEKMSSLSPTKQISISEDNQAQISPPKSPFKKIPISPVDQSMSPKPVHKEIEVLHNLQRDISPKRPLSKTITSEAKTTIELHHSENPETTNNSTPIISAIKLDSWEDLGLVGPEVLKDLKSGDWRFRLHAISSIEEALKSSDNLALVQPNLDSLLRTMLSSEKNVDVAEDKRRVIINLISRLPLENLENRTTQIITGLCRQGGPGSNRVSKALMQRLPPAVIVLKLLSDEFLHARSSRFRENALQMVIYALMTFPSTCFDTTTCIKLATSAAFDKKRRVRQAALDVLAILGQVTSPKICMEIVQNVLSFRTDVAIADATDLYSAVKARLSRKQLPYITSDGNVHYTLRVPSPNHFKEPLEHLGADIQWIASGIGSVSPTSIKRRLRYSDPGPKNNSNFFSDSNNRSNVVRRHIKPPHELLAYGVGVKKIDNEEVSTHQEAPSSQIGLLKSNIGNGEIIGINGRRIATKSYSDSSQDGRNSDSTYTINDNRSFLKHPVTSRFPTVERFNGNASTNEKQAFDNPYNFVLPNGNRLSVTYPRPTYSVHKKRSYYKDDRVENGDGVFYETTDGYSGQNQKRFVNVDKFMQSNKKTHQNSNTSSKNEERKFPTEYRFIPTPIPNIQSDPNNHPDFSSNENTTNESSEISSSDGIISSSGHSTPTATNHIEDLSNNIKEMSNHIEDVSTISTSQTTTAFETETDVTKIITRPQSSILFSRPVSSLSKKSFMMHEDNLYNIDEPDDFQRIEQIDAEEQHEHSNENDKVKSEGFGSKIELNSIETVKGLDEENFEKEDSSKNSSQNKNHDSNHTNDTNNNFSQPDENFEEKNENTKFNAQYQVDPFARSPSPFEKDSISRQPSLLSKSCESVYQSPRKADLDMQSTGSTETSTDYPPSAISLDLDCPLSKTIGNITTKATQGKTPPQMLIRKSKTTLFGSRNRRISPVKQSLKLNKCELYPQTLIKFEKPRDGINLCFQQLESENWETVLSGLVSIVRLMRHHPENLDTHMHVAAIHLSKAIRNLRSQVARAACQAATELFTIPGKFLEQECDDVVGSLLQRTSDTNRFLRADATRALMSMCDNLTPPKILQLLTSRGMAHQNAVVRTTTAKLFNRFIDRLGIERVYTMSRESKEKIFVAGGNLLLEGSLETRCYAKTLFKSLSDHPNYNKFLLEYIPSRTYRNIEKTLKSIK